MKTLTTWHVFLAKIMTGFYFSKIQVQGKLSQKPTLYIASHRNGATDGQVYTWALGKTPSLISIQMLRKWFLRIIFDGIAVVRPVDTERYRISADQVASPIEEAIKQISVGGSLCLMPEGTSEWGYRPQKYKQGMAKIVQELKAKGIDFEVKAVGVFYTKPDGFRSRVSIVLAEPFLPESVEIDEIFHEMSDKLDDVSVNCQSVAEFNQRQSFAWQQAQIAKQDYGLAFLSADLNTTHASYQPAQTPIWQSSIKIIIKLIFVLTFFPTVLFAKLAEKGADGRNNVTFFRLLGGFYGSILTLILWIVLFFIDLSCAMAWIVSAILSWYFYPEPMPKALKDNA